MKLSVNYATAMGWLDKMRERDWTLEDACYQCRKAAESKDILRIEKAEDWLLHVMERVYKNGR